MSDNHNTHPSPMFPVDTSKPIFRTKNGYYVDENENSIKKVNESVNDVQILNEIIDLQNYLTNVHRDKVISVKKK